MTHEEEAGVPRGGAAGARRAVGARAGGLGHAAAAGWRRLVLEQKAAGLAALLLGLSTIGPFSWIEAAEIVVAFAVLLLVGARARGAKLRVPFGDGTLIAAAGAWAVLLILLRLLERPLGQTLLALACAAVLLAVGLHERGRQHPGPAASEPAEG